MNRQELLELARSEREALHDVLAKLTEDELCAPVLDGGRSMKDQLAHITIWERRVITAIAIGRTGEAPAWPEPSFMPWDTDKLNERDFLANRDRPLADVVAGARETFNEMLALIESFSEDDIGGELPFTPGIPLIAIIRGNADEHYRDLVPVWG